VATWVVAPASRRDASSAREKKGVFTERFHKDEVVLIGRFLMKTKLILLGTLSLALLLSSCCCVGGIDNDWNRYRNEFEKSYTIQAPAKVTVRNLDGFVHVSSWDKNEVLVKGVISLRAENEKEALRRMKEIDVIISHEDNSLTITVERRRHRGLSELWRHATNWRVDLELSVPGESSLAISTVDGALRLSGIKGKHKLSTVDGAIEAQGLEGIIDCRTVDGACSLTDVRGDVEVSTTDGSIRVEGRISGLKATAVDGRIHIEALEGSTVAQEWRLSSVSGSITLGVPQSFSADLEASTVDGQISIRAPAELGMMTERKVTAKLGKGGGPISIATTDGSIRIALSGTEGEADND
jgi:hypothetical protein